MTENSTTLPDSVTTVEVNNKTIYLLGTAHVSKESVEDVKNTISTVNPESVCVELCESRHKAIVEKNNWQKMNIFKVVKQKKALFLLTQLIMSSFYKKLGDKLDIKPGAEMIEGINQAKERDLDLVLADRNIEITLKRVWGFLSFWQKMKMLSHLLAGFFINEDIDEEMIEDMKKQDQLENALNTFAETFPQVKSKLIDERDIYLAQKIRNAPGDTVVAVVGAGHVPGIVEHIQEEQSLDAICEIPPRSITPKIVAWAIPLGILGLFAYGFMNGKTGVAVDSVWIWILVNSIACAIGAAIAFGHPLTVFTAFIAAPLTSLNPMIAAGMVTGLVQAMIKKPTVSDFEKLPTMISSTKGFWMNPVTRILLVVLLSNLGSAIGTFTATSMIANKILG